MQFNPVVQNIPLEGSVSPNFDLGLSFYFMTKKGNFLLSFQT